MGDQRAIFYAPSHTYRGQPESTDYGQKGKLEKMQTPFFFKKKRYPELRALFDAMALSTKAHLG
jgi:hypothetical protein